MSKDKLQLCVSFKHTKEEEELYAYVIGQSDKSVFIKNLIRAHKENRPLSNVVQYEQIKLQGQIEEPVKQHVMNNGKKTKNRFLA